MQFECLGSATLELMAARRKAKFIEPMLLLRTDALPADGGRWEYQLKFDGYRPSRRHVSTTWRRIRVLKNKDGSEVRLRQATADNVHVACQP